MFAEEKELWSKYTAYLNQLNHVVAQLISALTRANPRNISEVARMTGLSPSLAHYHLKRLLNNKMLKITTKINYPKIGLRPSYILIEILPRKRIFVKEALKANDYWNYIAPCFGYYNGFYVSAAIPFGKEIEFKSFLESMQQSGLIKRFLIEWVEDIIDISRGFYWFDFKRKKWLFRWNDWIKEIVNGSSSSTSKVDFDQNNLMFKPDYIDIFILKELEKDACVSFREIASKLEMTPPAIRYHYYNHVLRFKLIRGYRPVVFPYPSSVADMYVFRVEFNNNVLLNKFIKSLNGKPFSSSVAKVVNKNVIYMNVYLPKLEFFNFVNALLSLASIGVISDFSYIILDIKNYLRQTIPYERYVDGRWIYPHKQYISRVQEIARKAVKLRSIPA
ncbi:MAG: Lrp/AsnC family transcriptional regulator [archaeon GB-1867-005]|nr:Lrp/AsnC family transcriptional regulator [Candidatus Culexmicrobium cathedralense]